MYHILYRFCKKTEVVLQVFRLYLYQPIKIYWPEESRCRIITHHYGLWLRPRTYTRWPICGQQSWWAWLIRADDVGLGAAYTDWPLTTDRCSRVTYWPWRHGADEIANRSLLNSHRPTPSAFHEHAPAAASSENDHLDDYLPPPPCCRLLTSTPAG